MASGYVVAAFLETAGLIGLVIAAFKMRTERLAKVNELRSFLHSGQTSVSAPDLSGPRRRAGLGQRVIDVPFIPGRHAAQPLQASPARSALERAVVRGSQGLQSVHLSPLSAG